MARLTAFLRHFQDQQAAVSLKGIQKVLGLATKDALLFGKTAPNKDVIADVLCAPGAATERDGFLVF
jgi:hypothetical protein